LKRPAHLPSLDTVRGLAILLVIAHNAQLLQPEGMGSVVAAAEYVLNLGWIGVQLFFVLSGFLITGILMDHLDSPGAMKNFFVRRALRIFPLYYGPLFVLFVLLPAIILSGLAMSPALDAAWPWLVDLFGGRQSARSVHFIAAMGLVLFFLVHIAMVVLAGPINEVRSMLTGWYRLPKEREEQA